MKEVEALANSIKGKKVQNIRIIEYKRNEEDCKRSYPYKGVGQKKQSVRQHKTSVAKVDSIGNLLIFVLLFYIHPNGKCLCFRCCFRIGIDALFSLYLMKYKLFWKNI